MATKLNGDVWCDSYPHGSIVGNCSQPATVEVTRDFASPYDVPQVPSIWVTNHCEGHAAALRDSSAYPKREETLMALHGKKTLAAIQNGADKFVPFKIGYISGSKTARGVGRLPERYRKLWYYDTQDWGIEYVFYSYETPIAWKPKDSGWVIPEAYYSSSSTGHRSRVRVAIDNKGYWLR